MAIPFFSFLLQLKEQKLVDGRLRFHGLALRNKICGVYESYFRGWLIKPDKSKNSFLKMREWNQMKIYLKRDKISTWLNVTPIGST